MQFVNYKNIHDRPTPNAPALEDIVEELFINTSICFGDENMDESDYVVRLVDYLHNDLKHVSSPPRKKTCKTVYVTFRDENFKVKQCDALFHLKNRWELFVLLNEKKHVVASCLVHFNDIYHTCEIHEVCVGEAGKGYCKILMTKVKNHISKGLSGRVNEIRIFCEKGNIAACKCYGSVFKDASIFDTDITTGYVYQVIPKSKSMS